MWPRPPENVEPRKPERTLGCPWAKPERALERRKVPGLQTEGGERVTHVHLPPGHWFQRSLADLNRKLLPSVL